jgi:3-hydroxyisobutyrate dehydrogenase
MTDPTTSASAAATSPRRVAVVGLGNMGGPMAANLVKAGHRVTGFDLVPSAVEAAAATGVTVAASGADAVRDADIVLTMLPAGRHVLSAYQGSDGVEGLLAAARPGAVFIDSSTIDVADARAAAAAATAAGHRALDAPVSGGTVGAAAGTLTFMVGATDQDFAEVAPVLSAMARKVVHCGGSGAGQAAKVCNNMILGISMIAVSEAFVLGEALGLTDEALFEVASNATAQCWALNTNCPVPGPVPTSPANRDYAPGFAAALMAKDLGLAANAISAGGVDAQLGLAAARVYAELADSDRAGQDFSTVINVIRERSTVQATS